MNQADRLFEAFVVLGKSKINKNNNRVSQGEMAILNALYLYGPLTPSRLCEITNMSSAHTAKTICSLKLKKDITRSIDVHDKRSALIELTETGKEKIVQLHLLVKEQLSELAEFLGEEDCEHLIRIINRISNKGEVK